MSFTKKSFAILLSKLKVFDKPNAKLEQYPTDSECAAVVIWSAALNGDIEGKSVADLGCGTGILGIGALLLGAKKVSFYDIDESAINIAKENYNKVFEEYEIGEAEFIVSDISNVNGKFDLVLQNPPFGVQSNHADRPFLMKSFEISPLVYSFHMSETKEFVEKMAEKMGFDLTKEFMMDFPIKATMDFHKKKIHKIKVSTFRLEKIIIAK